MKRRSFTRYTQRGDAINKAACARNNPLNPLAGGWYNQWNEVHSSFTAALTHLLRLFHRKIGNNQPADLMGIQLGKKRIQSHLHYRIKISEQNKRQLTACLAGLQRSLHADTQMYIAAQRSG
ncbi:hypothetical protein D3C80_1757050 [compost metagenome]